MKKLICVLLLLCLLTACGGKKTGVEVPDANGDGKLTCTIEVRCDTLLDKLSELPEGKAALVPGDGVLLAATEVEFSAGDAAFDVLRSTLREKKIHFEYTDASAYNAVYIEGIGNLYEYDCGPQSGWMYSVNGTFPSLGSSSYTLSDGDVVVFNYTCDLGSDLEAGWNES